MKINNIAIIYPSLTPRYRSYGDHWVDAAKMIFPKETYYYDYKNDIVIPNDHDLYLFIEALPHWFNLPANKYHPRILYCWDTHLSYFCYLMSLINNFDIIFMASKIDSERLKSYGNVEWMPPGYNKLLHRDLGIMKKWDIGFIGQQDNIIRRYPESRTRLEVLQSIQEIFKKKAFIGYGFYGEDYVRIMNECKVMLDYRTHFEIGTRCYEALGMGVPVLTQYVEEQFSHAKYPFATLIQWADQSFANIDKTFFAKNDILSGIVHDQSTWKNLYGCSYTDRLLSMIETVEQKIPILISKNQTKVEMSSKSEMLPVATGMTYGYTGMQEVKPKIAKTDYKLLNRKIGVIIPTKWAIPTIVHEVCLLQSAFNDMNIDYKIIIVEDDIIKYKENFKADFTLYTRSNNSVVDHYIYVYGERIFPGLDEVFYNNRTWFMRHPSGINFTDKVNLGLKALLLDPSIFYILVANDDVIPAKNCIERMIDTINSYKYDIVGPFSNCDRGWRHNKVSGLPNRKIMEEDDNFIELKVGMKYEEFGPEYERKLSNTESKSYNLIGTCGGGVKPIEWVAFYFTLFRRDIFDTYGLLNKNLKVTCSDREFCERLPNGRVGYSFNSFAFHYGAVTRKVDDNEEHKLYQSIDHEDVEKYSAILNCNHLSSSIKNIVFYSGPSWEKWSYTNLNKDGSGIGGSETCQLYLAKELSKLGYNVKMYYDWDGVENFCSLVDSYLYSEFDPNIYGKDTCIISVRQPLLRNELKDFDGIKLLWNHDIIYNDDINEILDFYDGIINLSIWHKNYWLERCIKRNEQINKIFIINDGINGDYVDHYIGSRTKNYYDNNPIKLIYSSSWDRGLDILVNILKNTNDKNISLDVYYGTYNLEKWIKQSNNIELGRWLNNLKQMIDKDKRIRIHNRVSEPVLMDAFYNSDIWIYPTYFYETYCLSALMAQVANCHIITRPLAALSETVGNRVYSMIDGDVHDKNVQNKYLEELHKCIIDIRNNGRIIMAGDDTLEYIKAHTWPNIALQWQYLIDNLGRNK